MSKIRSEDAPTYLSTDEDTIIAKALEILQGRLKQPEAMIESPDSARDFVRLKLAGLPHEVFSVMFLNNRHGVIAYEEMFRGTIDGASVHPREVVKAALQHNAAAVIFIHNHPSGNENPSLSDQRITSRLIDALALVDVKVLDHMIVGHGPVYSFAEKGLI